MAALAKQTAIVAALSGIFAGRVYPVAAADGAAMPYAVLSLSSSDVEATMCGRSDLTNYRFRLDVYAATMVELLTLRPMILNAMDAFGLPVLETDAYEPEVRAMRRVMDFSVWDKE